jgi:hypothetical protein
LFAFLELRASSKLASDHFWKSLNSENEEGRWQNVNASLNAVGLIILVEDLSVSKRSNTLRLVEQNQNPLAGRKFLTNHLHALKVEAFSFSNFRTEFF